MQEIEIKAYLKDEELARLRLEALGCIFSDPIQQEDTVYVEKVGSLEVFLSNRVFLRIRVNNSSQIVFTAKKRTAALVALEHEVEVESKDELEKMLSMMGYVEAMRVSKVRCTTHYNGCEICIDQVKDLGTFIEMEKLSANGDAGVIQEELFLFFETLGITRADRVTKGYDILMFEKT